MGLEIRWFFEGLMPSSVESWFQSQTLQRFLAPAEERTDIYLRNRDDNLGLKLRAGRLDIKWRRYLEEFVGAGGKVSGQAEDWITWVWTDTAGNAAREIESSLSGDYDSPWIEVAKKRLQLRYVFEGYRFVAVRMDEQVEHGCAVELTKVRAHDQWWWTFALDVFGGRGEATMILRQRIDTLFADYPGLDLRLEDSYGYPRWLSSVG